MTGTVISPAGPLIVLKSFLDTSPEITAASPNVSRACVLNERFEITGIPFKLPDPSSLNSVSISSVTSRLP